MGHHELWFTELLNNYLAAPAQAVLNLFGVHAANPDRPWVNFVAMEILVGLVIVVLFAIAWWLRRDTPGAPSGLPLALEVIGLLAALVTGWLGGELVDRLGVGVDPGANLDAPSSLSNRPASGA